MESRAASRLARRHGPCEIGVARLARPRSVDLLRRGADFVLGGGSLRVSERLRRIVLSNPTTRCTLAWGSDKIIGVELDATSLERLVPDQLTPDDVTGEEALRISLERYAFAARHARPGRLLDVACGVGYGTRFLSDESPAVTDALGVDLSEAAVGYASQRYANDRTRFRACDAMQLEDAAGFDTIVSIETIEHLPDPQHFVERLLQVLRPGGHLVGSVPITPSVDANPHHLHDFSDRSFRDLFAAHGLESVGELVQDQPFRLRALLTRSEARLASLRPNLPAWYLRHPDALLRRLGSTMRHGLVNRYLTVAWRARG